MNTVIVNGVNVTEELEKLKELHIKQTKLLGLYRNLSMETDVFGRSKYWKQINKIELEELE